jgi:hypothetical protein
MFAIATPQTIKLMETPWVDPAQPVAPPDEAKPAECAGTVSFEHAHDDVSQCRMTVRVGDKVWTHDFAVNGANTGSAYEDEAIRKAKVEAAKKAAEDAKVEAEKAKAPATDPDGKSYDATVTPGTDGYVRQEPVLKPNVKEPA